MFYTQENGRSLVPPALFDSDGHCWDYVSLDSWSPWFLVTVETTYGVDETWMSTLFLRKAEQLEELTQRTDQKIVCVQMVQSCQDKQRGWQLEEVVCISRVLPVDSEDFIEFDFANGDFFTTADDNMVDLRNMNVKQRTNIWCTQVRSVQTTTVNKYFMSLPAIQIFGISNCSSMKKARTWLTDHDVAYEFIDYKKADIDEDTLRDWISVVGWEILLNRQGTTWRKVPQKIKESVDETTAINLMLENPSIIKRPVLKIGTRIVVGFKPDQYAEIFK